MAMMNFNFVDETMLLNNDNKTRTRIELSLDYFPDGEGVKQDKISCFRGQCDD